MPVIALLAWLSLGLSLASACSALFTCGRQGAALRWLALPLFSLAGLASMACGLDALLSQEVTTLTLPLGFPGDSGTLRIDALSGFFLTLIGVLSFPVGIYGIDYVREFDNGRDSPATLGFFSGLFIFGMLLVVMANDIFLFMLGWELMTLASYSLVAFQHERPANRRAAFLYLVMGQISGLCILFSFGILSVSGGGSGFEALRHAHLPLLWSSAAFSLALLGFGMKAGLVPLHVWLPEAHPAAPSHISALMSGVMLKVAVYGFLRLVFDLLGPWHWQWGVAVLVAGCTSALIGVLLALMETDLKRLLAYSSVENIGIIFIGLGLSMVFFGSGHRLLGVLALLAALYHTLNHTLFKGLLFLGAGAILHSTHERNLDQMGGLLRRMPATGWFFLIGSLAISGLPPLNGFVSEWLTFQAALQSWQLTNGVLRTLIPLAAAVLAMSAALAAATFVKTYGIAFLGRSRSRHVRRARPASVRMRLGQAWLAILCLLAGIFPTWILSVLEAIPQDLLGSELHQTDIYGWLWLTPISPQTASYSAPAVLAALILMTAITALLLRRKAVRRVRRCDAWDCGFAPPTSRMQYTAVAFTQPLRRVFASLLRINEGIDMPDGKPPRYYIQVEDPIWTACYRPLPKWINYLSRQIARIQAGNLRAYLARTLATLLVLLGIISL